MCKNPAKFANRTLPVGEALQGNLNTLHEALSQSDNELCESVKIELTKRINEAEKAVWNIALLIGSMKAASELVDLLKATNIAGIIALDDYVK